MSHARGSRSIRLSDSNRTILAAKELRHITQILVRPLIPTTPLSLALCFSALTMREIGLVIAPLDPRHKSEALFNRICMQGQHDLEEPAQLRHRECWRFFPPDVLSSAREKNGPAA